MKSILKVVSELLLMALPLFLSAQTHCQLRGTLETEGSGEGVFYATVVLLTSPSPCNSTAATLSLTLENSL